MKIIILIVFISYSSKLAAQNLVSNPSFEDYKVCPMGLNSLGSVQNYYPNLWENTDACGSSDFFNSCSKSQMVSVPKNAFGFQQARTGNAYMGIICFCSQNAPVPINSVGSEAQREYIQTKLNDSLVSGEMYCVKFFVSLADYSDYETSCIGAFLSTKKIGQEENFLTRINLTLPPQIENDTTKYLSKETEWEEISGVFVAKGGEQYIAIGDFYSSKENKVRKRKSRFFSLPSGVNCGHIAYYFIDDVSIEHIKNEFECKSLGTSIKLENIFFSSGNSNLLPESYKELNKLLGFLKNDLKISIEISGHTDNCGAEADNLKLSKARAKSIADFLIKNGINKKRINYKGWGATKPISSNTTENGRQLNRRVEFVFKKQ